MHKIALALLLLGVPAAAQKKPVTLDVAARPVTPPDQAMSAPVWSPDGDSLAFTVGKKLWVYDARSNSKRELGSLEPLEKAAAKPDKDEPFLWENRRVVDEKIQWMPDRKTLLLYVERDLFLWPIESGKWTQLTHTTEAERNPKLSPDGRIVSFQRNNELHVLDLKSGKSRRLTSDSSATLWNARLDWVYPEELALGTAHFWSPDSKHIAFLQFDVGREWIYPHANLLDRKAVYEPQRYPKAGTPNPDVRLGVIPAAGGKVKWMNLGGTRDALLARVVWLPDSRRIAVQRLNRVQNELTLLFVDSATGSAKAVLTERDPFWVNVSDDLRFLEKRDAFVWSSEKDGFRHLYLYDYDGKELQRLTKGEWEVKSVAAIDENRGVVYFHSRQRSPIGTDLAAVNMDGDNHRLITAKKGQHNTTISPSADFYVDTYQSVTEPPRKTLHKISGEQVAVLQPPTSAADEYEFIKPEIVKVKASDGALMYASLLKPANFDPSKKYPAIVQVYGGPHAQNVCECYAGLNWDQALAQRGFVVWQLDNRGTAGRGHAWESKLYRRFGKQELADQQEGVQHLVSLGFVDPQRIGIYGWSYGGFMTLYSLFNAPDLFRAGVAGAPVTNWLNYDTIYTERYLGLPSENADGYKASSPIHQAANLKAPLMLVHNYGDDNVLFQQSFQMLVELQKANKLFETAIYPQRTHGVTGDAKKHLLETITGFFERHLK